MKKKLILLSITATFFFITTISLLVIAIDTTRLNNELQAEIDTHEGQMMELNYKLHREQQSLSILIKELGRE